MGDQSRDTTQFNNKDSVVSRGRAGYNNSNSEKQGNKLLESRDTNATLRGSSENNRQNQSNQSSPGMQPN